MWAIVKKYAKKAAIVAATALGVACVAYFLWGFAWVGIPAICRGCQKTGTWLASQVAYYTGTGASPSGGASASSDPASSVAIGKMARNEKIEAQEHDLQGRLLDNKADHLTQEEADAVRILKGEAKPGDQVAIYLVDKSGGMVYAPYTVHVDGLTQDVSPSTGHEGQPFPAIRDHTYKVWAETPDGRRTAQVDAVLPSGMDHVPFYPLVLPDPPLAAAGSAPKSSWWPF